MVVASLLAELEDVIRQGTPQWRIKALQRITALFLAGAGRFNDAHVGLFDVILGRLIDATETRARAELAHRLAALGNAPAGVIRTLARDDDISVAGAVLRHSPRLAATDLLAIAMSKSQAHLLAISGRADIAEPVTGILVRRGSRAVVHSVADNPAARLSHRSVATLIDRAQADGALAARITRRPDIAPRQCQDLLVKATAVVRERLVADAKPRMGVAIERLPAPASGGVETSAWPRDYTAARAKVDALERQGRLDEGQLVEFAKARRYEEMVVALARLCAVPIEVVDRLLRGERPDPVLILAKAAGWGWATAKTVIDSLITAPARQPASARQRLDDACRNFESLSPATAQRVMRFWQARRPRDAAQNRTLR